MTIKKLLIANRGEIASRIISSAHDMGISCVAIYTEADKDTPYVREADQAFKLSDSYLNSKEILDIALKSNSDAIHPGYGFLSENAAFANQVKKLNIKWVGPSSNAIKKMGDKLTAKEIAIKANVPTLPMTSDPKKANSIGYPILVKAAAGGGGKGMRIVEKARDLKESIKAAISIVKSQASQYNIGSEDFKKIDIHVHVPEGATPKDGPSAGIGMVTSIVSSITNIPVRRDVAMTGEVTLTGQVLPIGGLKEKLLAAHRAGIKEVLIPKENEKDLVDMPKKIIDDIKITPVEYADQVIKIALTKELKPTEWVEVDISKKDDKSQASIQ